MSPCNQIMSYIMPSSIAFSSARAVRRRLWWYLTLSSNAVWKNIGRSTMCGSDGASLCSIGFGGVSPERFAFPSFKWNWQPESYVIYRCLIALYQLIWLVLVLIVWGTEPHYSPVDTKWKWLIYISNWSYLLLTVYFIFAAVAVIVYHKHKSNTVDEDMELAEQGGQSDQSASTAQTLPCYFSLMWFLQVVAYSAAVAVALLYWVLDYDPAEDSVHIYGVHVHGINVVLVLIDVLVVANPCRFLHFIYVSLYTLIYFIFTAIYWAAGGLNSKGDSYIYKGMLDWEKDPGMSAIVTALSVIVCASVVHSLFWLLFKIKEAVFK